MNAEQLNAWAGRKASGANKTALVAQLTLGSMPQGQGSSIAPVNDTPGDVINENAVPFVEGGYPQHIAPPSTPGTQHLQVAPTAQVPSWVSVPACAASRQPTRQRPIGLTGDGGTGAVLNLPAKSRAPKLFTAAPI